MNLSFKGIPMKKLSLYCALIFLCSCNNSRINTADNAPSLIDQWYGPHHFDEKPKSTETKESQAIEGTLSIAEMPSSFEEAPVLKDEATAKEDTALPIEEESIVLDESFSESEVLAL